MTDDRAPGAPHREPDETRLWRFVWTDDNLPDIIPATTDTPEYRLASLDRYPKHERAWLKADAERAIADRQRRDNQRDSSPA